MPVPWVPTKADAATSLPGLVFHETKVNHPSAEIDDGEIPSSVDYGIIAVRGGSSPSPNLGW